MSNAEPSPKGDRGLARRHAFLQAARTVFLEHGYEAASVNDVVRLAGGSLATLYSQFGNKEGLFLAVAQDQHERFTHDMTPVNIADLGFEESLQAIGESLLRALVAREHLAFYRIFIGEGRKFPQLLQRFLASGADRVRGVVADMLRAWAAKNGVALENPDLLAGFFFDMVRSRLHYHSLADASYTPSESEIREQVSQAVRLLLDGIRPR